MASVWLFGYGSLIWRPDFEFVSHKVAWVDGWSRRFWQGSHDHRGVPDAPGRVVTLIPVPGERCGGMAFEIEEAMAAKIFDQLDYREKNGYERHRSRLLFGAEPDDEPVEGIFYVASEGNPAFLGPASAVDIAKQISVSVGPSGANSEYLINLAEALRIHGIDDEHVFEIEAELIQAM